jgi:hypothetical protein
MGAETANATVTVLRGTAEDDWGDEIDAPQPLYRDVPFTLIETAQVVQDPSTQTPRVIRAITGLGPQWLGLQTTDRLRDQGTGDVLIIVDVITQPNLTGAPADVKVILRRVGPGGS